MNSSTIALEVKATWSTSVRGGSKSSCRVSSGGGTRGCTVLGSSPDAWVWSRRPC